MSKKKTAKIYRESTGKGHNLKAAHKARVGKVGHYTADETKMLAWLPERKGGPFTLSAKGVPLAPTAASLYASKDVGKVGPSRRARNAVRKLIRQGLVQPTGERGVYKAVGR